ncbi:N-acetylmuramic acid 6-phosphate etherase [Stigmatella aurantiaca]|uniref:N-acetylmuramic acid 6-phosphate etherase n=1 Tax=Stigmatella aurantiaca TaxID=41 RepID=A0A1H7QAH3_STIAU|nr:N-acetylmuramic acid 6-phosphate etherase [Stigmatella aurantiaca]
MAKETEGAARRFQGLDAWGTGELLETLWGGPSRATAADAAPAPSNGNLRTALSALSSQEKGGPCPR